MWLIFGRTEGHILQRARFFGVGHFLNDPVSVGHRSWRGHSSIFWHGVGTPSVRWPRGEARMLLVIWSHWFSIARVRLKRRRGMFIFLSSTRTHTENERPPWRIFSSVYSPGRLTMGP